MGRTDRYAKMALLVDHTVTSSVQDQKRRTNWACIGQGGEHPTRFLSLASCLRRRLRITNGQRLYSAGWKGSVRVAPIVHLLLPFGGGFGPVRTSS